jgi:uncharacterized membrane protein (DUF4010 family)
MHDLNPLWLNLVVALGIGLLIGAERERNKGSGPDRSPAGIRTFAIAAMLGGVSTMLHEWLLLVVVLGVIVFTATSYYSRSSQDPGLTTEIALVLTVILGSSAMSDMALAAALGVMLAILLAAKAPIHGFVKHVITQAELHDLLILAAATLIILPIVPNQFIGPFAAINLRYLWLIVIFVMLIGAISHIALRVLGGRIGLPIVGLISGFISSVATIGSMGARAKTTHELTSAAAAGALLSSLSTILQLALLLIAIHPATLKPLIWPLLFGAVSIAVYGGIITLHSYRNQTATTTSTTTNAFSLLSAFKFACMIAVVLIAAAGLKVWFGQAGLIMASAVAGLVDVHAAAISVTTLTLTDAISTEQAVIPILVALTVNSVSKAIMAVVSGSRLFANYVIAGLVLQIAAVWLAWWLF